LNEEYPSKRQKSLSNADEKVDGKQTLSLPPPLSPTLPPFVEKLLARSKDQSLKKESETEVKRRSSGASKKPPTNDTSEPILDPENATKRQLSNKTTQVRKPISSKSVGEPSKPITNGTQSAEKVHRPTTSISNSEAGSLRTVSVLGDDQTAEPSKIVKLKIPQKLRLNVSRMLKLPARSKSKLLDPKPKITEKLDVKEDIPNQKERTAEKRPRQDDDEQANGKRFKSPVLANRPSGKRPRESTPITREEASTPQDQILTGTPAAPNSIERPIKDARHTPSDSGSSHSATSEMIDSLKKEQTKYFELGRAVKKDSDKIFKAGQDPVSPAQMKKYLAMRIEVTLSFMLAYIIGDEINKLRRVQSRPENTWATLFPWLHQLVQQITGDPHLSGFALQLEAVCLMVAWNSETEHVANSGIDNTDKFKKLKRQYDDAQRKFIEGTARLSVDDLQQDFPKTWRAKAHSPLQSNFKLTKDTLNGDFYLPITGITLPIEAVRAGKSLLAEWCRREGVDWTARLTF
jgi:hypothetical protein